MENLERESVLKGDSLTLFNKVWSSDMIVSTPANVVGTVEGTKQHFRTGGLNYLTFERIIERITFHDDIAIVMGDEIIRPPVDEDPSRFVMAKDLYHHLGKQVEVLVYYITQKPVRTKGGQLMYFGTFIDSQGDWVDSVHFPDVAQKHRLTGRGYYHMRGKVVEEFGVYSLEVTWLRKVGLINGI